MTFWETVSAVLIANAITGLVWSLSYYVFSIRAQR